VQVSANERSPGCPFVDITYKSLWTEII
jgi:hypothetical protein